MTENKFFHRLSTRIFLEILLSAAVGAVVFFAVNTALIHFFQYYAGQPEVFRELSDRHFEELQDYARENHLVSTDGKPFTAWNDQHSYVSLMIIRQNEAMCYNSFVSYNMTYTEEDKETFYWGSKVLPTYEYWLELEDETCKVYFSGYFDQTYESLRIVISGVCMVASFALLFFLLFQKYIRYIGEMNRHVSSICNKNFGRPIAIRSRTELSTLAASINHLSDTIELLLLTEDAKQKQKEQFVKSIAHDIRTPLTAVIGYLELLQKTCADSRDGSAMFAQRALEKANHIRGLTDDLFTFEQSCRELPLELYDGQELLDKITSSITNYLKGQRFHLAYSSDIDVPFQMKTNITLLMRLIDNICSNIMKHADPDKPVELMAALADGQLLLEERNVVRRQSVKELAENSGFGLVICEDMMAALGGSVSHEESDGCFRICFRFPVVMK